MQVSMNFEVIVKKILTFTEISINQATSPTQNNVLLTSVLLTQLLYLLTN